MRNVTTPGLPCSPVLRPKKAAPLRTKLRFKFDTSHHQRGAIAD